MSHCYCWLQQMDGWCWFSRPTSELLFHDNQTYLEMVEKGVLAAGGYCNHQFMDNLPYQLPQFWNQVTKAVSHQVGYRACSTALDSQSQPIVPSLSKKLQGQETNNSSDPSKWQAFPLQEVDARQVCSLLQAGISNHWKKGHKNAKFLSKMWYLPLLWYVLWALSRSFLHIVLQ